MINKINVISYMESEEYKEWFLNEMLKSFVKTLKTMKEEGFAIEDSIRCLEEKVKEV